MSFYEHEHFDLVRSIYASCALSSFWLGILLNIFLGWLILKKTPAPMQIYNKLLLAPCLMCILIAISTFLVQPIPIVDHGFHAVIQNGPIRDLPQPWNYTANVLWFQMLLLFVCCTTVQFSFRYYMLSRDGQIPLKWKYLTGFLVYLLLVAHVALHYWSDYPSEDQMPSMIQLAKQVHLELGITDIHFSSFTWARSFPWLLHCFAMIAIFAVCYWIILFCALKTSRFIDNLYGNNLPECKNTKKGKRAKIGEIGKNKKNEKIRQYHSQVTMAFIIQAILPTIEVVELTIQTTLPAFFPTNQTVHYMVYAAIPLYFIPVLNPLATMLLVKPYQMAVLKMLGLRIGQRKVITTVIHEGRMIRNSLIGHQQPIIISPHAVEPLFSIA